MNTSYGDFQNWASRNSWFSILTYEDTYYDPTIDESQPCSKTKYLTPTGRIVTVKHTVSNILAVKTE